MNWSFIICTHDPNQDKLEDSIKTIIDLSIPFYEILVIGGLREKSHSFHNTSFIPFDESANPGWITKKKNQAATFAKYDHLCILHDYYAFDKNWYVGWNSLDKDWDIGCNKIYLINGARDWTDWCLWDHPTKGFGPLSYDEKMYTKNQYISGGFFCVKKDFFLANPLNETLMSHQEEDIEWSLRVRDSAKIRFNKNSIVRQIKFHRNMKKWRKFSKQNI